jgi:hypothetical protein
MPFKLGDFFPRKIINEPFLALNDPRWSELEGGYRGTLYDASKTLIRLEEVNNLKQADEIYQELWENLHHQGDIGIASYYAVPHLVRIAEEKSLIDYNVLSLVSLIEIQRHKNNPVIPDALYPIFRLALIKLLDLATSLLSGDCDLTTVTAALTAMAVAKGQIKLGNAIQNMDSEDVIDEFLEQY